MGRLGNAAILIPGAIGMFGKDALAAVGGYRKSTVAGDMDITIRLRAAGYRIGYTGKAVCKTQTPCNVKNLWKQRRRWHQGLIGVFVIHRYYCIESFGIGLHFTIEFLGILWVLIEPVILVLAFSIGVSGIVYPCADDKHSVIG